MTLQPISVMPKEIEIDLSKHDIRDTPELRLIRRKTEYQQKNLFCNRCFSTDVRTMLSHAKALQMAEYQRYGRVSTPLPNVDTAFPDSVFAQYTKRMKPKKDKPVSTYHGIYTNPVTNASQKRTEFMVDFECEICSAGHSVGIDEAQALKFGWKPAGDFKLPAQS